MGLTQIKNPCTFYKIMDKLIMDGLVIKYPIDKGKGRINYVWEITTLGADACFICGIKRYDSNI